MIKRGKIIPQKIYIDTQPEFLQYLDTDKYYVGTPYQQSFIVQQPLPQIAEIEVASEQYNPELVMTTDQEFDYLGRYDKKFLCTLNKIEGLKVDNLYQAFTQMRMQVINQRFRNLQLVKVLNKEITHEELDYDELETHRLLLKLNEYTADLDRKQQYVDELCEKIRNQNMLIAESRALNEKLGSENKYLTTLVADRHNRLEYLESEAEKIALLQNKLSLQSQHALALEQDKLKQIQLLKDQIDAANRDSSKYHEIVLDQKLQITDLLQKIQVQEQNFSNSGFQEQITKLQSGLAVARQQVLSGRNNEERCWKCYHFCKSQLIAVYVKFKDIKQQLISEKTVVLGRLTEVGTAVKQMNSALEKLLRENFQLQSQVSALEQQVTQQQQAALRTNKSVLRSNRMSINYGYKDNGSKDFK